jgi:hypothetical protein
MQLRFAFVLVALGASCGGRHSSVSSAGTDVSAGASGVADGGVPGAPSCGSEACPQQAGTAVCCVSSNGCGYVGIVSGPCVRSVSGGQVQLVVEYPDGILCPALPCMSGTGCPAAMPALGSACTATGPCNYCYAGDLSRSYDCKSGVWSDLGVSDCYSESTVE